MSAEPVEPVAIAEPSGSPFLQLEFYRQTDQARFAGRDDEINAVVTGILSFDTFVVYGRSGLGKTSLLLAGVFPQLQQRGVTPIYTRVLDLPVPELRKKIEAEIAAVPGSVILILDQFEEFFIRVREQNEDHPSRRMSACREMSAMLQDVRRFSGGRVRLLFGIREDYYAELEDFRAELPNIAAHGFRLLPLTAYGARRAIILMLERAHPPVVYEPNLVNLLLDEIARTGFDPLLLQIICGEVWREANAKREGTNELRAEDLESVGGFEQIFQRYVERAAKTTIDPLLVRVLLDTLITADQTKRVVRGSDLLRDGAATRVYVRASREEVDALLAQLVELQLVRPVGESRERYELLHDRLVPVVKKWLESDKTFVDFRFAKKFIDSMASGGEFRTNIGRLISNAQLEQIVNRYAERLQLAPDETELLFRSSIHAGVRDWTVFWASRLDETGAERSSKTMDEMLTSMDFRLRLAAATAVWALKSGPMFVPRLLQMAMEDRADIREAAARSFATLASDHDLATLAEHLGNPRSYQRATAIVVECYDQQRPLHQFSWLIRRRAWLAMRARSAAAQGEEIRKTMVRGAIHGTFAGMVWAMTVAFAIAEIMSWNTRPAAVVKGELGSRATVLIVLALLGAAAGVLLGWASSRRMARREALKERELYYGGPTRGITQALVTYVLAVAGLEIILNIPPPDPALNAPGVLIVAVIAVMMIAVFALRKDEVGTRERSAWLRAHRAWPWIALSAIAMLVIVLPELLDGFRDSFAPAALVTILSIPVASSVVLLRARCRAGNFAAALSWPLVVTGGVGLLGTVAILWLVELADVTTDDTRSMTVAGITALAVLLGCFRGAVIGSATDYVREEEMASPRDRVRFRAVALACLLFALIGYMALFGVSSVPWLAKRMPIGADLKGELLRNLPNTRYYKITGISDATRLVLFEPSGGYQIVTPASAAFGSAPYRGKTHLGFAREPFRVAVSRVAPQTSGYDVTTRAYPMRSGLVMDQNVIIGNLERVGNVWSGRRLGDLRLKTPMVLWDPESRRAFAVDVFVSFSADNTRTIENLSVKPFEQPLASIGIVRTEVSTATSIPNPLGFAGAKLKLIAVEKVDGSYQGPEDANGRE